MVGPATIRLWRVAADKASAGMLPFASPVGGEKCYLARQQYHVDRTASTGYGVRAPCGTTWFGDALDLTDRHHPAERSRVPGTGAGHGRHGTSLDLILVNLSSGGATLVNATISYTNESGTAGRARRHRSDQKRFDYLGLTHIVAKQSGDVGVSSPYQSLTFSATTSAGIIGLFLGKLVWRG